MECACAEMLGTIPCAGELGKAQPVTLSLLRVSCKRCSGSAMSQSTETLPKITGVFQPVYKPQCGMPSWDCFPWVANQLSMGQRGNRSSSL